MVTGENVLEALRRCKDPEVCFSIVDLGMIEKIEVDEGRVHVSLVPINSGCPFQVTMMQNAYQHIADMEGVSDVEIEFLNDMCWTPSRLSPDAKKIFGLE